MKKRQATSPAPPRKIRDSRVLSALCLGLILMPGAVFAAEPEETTILEEVVVTANRSETSREETTKSVSVIGSEDRDEQQQTFLPRLMDNEPGVFLRQSGGLGQWTTISIRGAGTQHTQVQYNGMPLRDASDTQSTLQYFIEDLYSHDNLDRVEILKGTNSVLYGSQAMGGVINMIPQKWGVGLKASLRNEFGPHSTYIGNARLAYGTDRWYVDFNPTYVTTDGEKYDGTKGYGYRNTGGALSAGFKPTDDTALELNALYSNVDLILTPYATSSHLENGRLVKNKLDSRDYHRKSQISQVGLNWTQKVNDVWDYSLKGAFSETMRHYINSTTPGDHSDYDGNAWYFEMQHNLHLTDWLTLNLGGDYEDMTYKGSEPKNAMYGDYSPYKTEDSWNSGDLFAQAQLAFLERTLLFNLGARLNIHEQFDEKAVWEVSGAYLLKESGTKFHASVATGYRTPSLYEVYGGYLDNYSIPGTSTWARIGNPNLSPEESTGFEVGVDQSFLDGKAQAGLAWFYTDFDDLITYDYTDQCENPMVGCYVNAQKAKTKGIEASLRLQPWDWMRLSLGYTYVDGKYQSAAGQWSRSNNLPRNKFNAALTLKPLDNLTFALTLRWHDAKLVSLSDRATWQTVRWEESGATTVDLAVSYKPVEHLEIFGRVDNLFDKDYTEGAYAMPGATLFGGLKISY